MNSLALWIALLLLADVADRLVAWLVVEAERRLGEVNG